MALLIQNSEFTTSGIPLQISDLYIDVMAILPHGKQDIQIRTESYAFENGQIASGLLSIDGVYNFSFPPDALVIDDFWKDVNVGNAHKYMIEKLEQEQPQWAGKISKILPQ